MTIINKKIQINTHVFTVINVPFIRSNERWIVVVMFAFVCLSMAIHPIWETR